MKLWILAILAATSLIAQDLTGTWQGALQAGRELRLVFKIAENDGVLKATLYSIDQGGVALPTGTVTAQNGTVKIPIPGIGGGFEGKLSADAKLITGTWSQGGGSLPLNLVRATPATAWTIPEAAARPKPKAADAKMAIEVATIKPAKPDVQGRGITVRAGRLVTINTSVTDLATFAYSVHQRQISGGPAWLSTDRFDLTIQPEGEGEPSLKQWKVLLQQLLESRFQLKFHRESRELTVYAITVGKNGIKMTKDDTDPKGLPGLAFPRLGMLPARNATMGDFAEALQTVVLDRPVVDQTGLTGRFDFTLQWTPDETQFASLGVRPPTPVDSKDPDFFTAVQEQLGLKIGAAKAPVQVMVIEQLEKPSGN